MNTILHRLSRGAECIAAMALAAIFIIFILQILTRYAAKLAWLMPIPSISEWMGTLEPIGWTVSLISLLWVWLIFFSCAFFVRDRDHVAFDIVYHSMNTRGRKVLAIAGAVIMIGAMLYSFWPTWDAFMVSRLMELKKIQTLRMPITGDKIDSGKMTLLAERPLDELKYFKHVEAPKEINFVDGARHGLFADLGTDPVTV